MVNLLCSFQATALTLDDKLSHIVQLTSLMVDQSYHKRVSNVLIEGRSEQSVQMDGDGNEERRNKDPEEFILVIIQVYYIVHNSNIAKKSLTQCQNNELLKLFGLRAKAMKGKTDFYATVGFLN